MPVVPTYEDRGIRLDPGLNFRDNTHATPEMFGSRVGDALGKAGQGLTNLGGAVAEVEDLDATNTAKDNNNGFMDGARELSYGENGYMNTTGRAAVEGLDGYRKGLLQLAQDGAKGLSPLAARKYWDATNVTLNSLSDEAAKHAMQQRKVWTAQTSQARVDTFRENAAASWGQPNAEKLDVIAAFTEYQQLGNLLGWNADDLAGQSAGLISDVHEDGILRKAEADPMGAAADIEAYKGFLLPEARERLTKTVGKAALDEETRLGALEFAGGTREPGEASRSYLSEAAEAGAVPKAGPTLERALLLGRVTGDDADKVIRLDPNFSTNLAALLEDAPSQYRDDINIRIPEGEADGKGRTVDLAYRGKTLFDAPLQLQDWARRNAGRYGMLMPIGGTGGAVMAATDGVAVRAQRPSADAIDKHLAGIADPDRREIARQAIVTSLDQQSRQERERQTAAKAELWRQVDAGATPDALPYTLRQAAGSGAMTVARAYVTKLAAGPIVSDDMLLADMRLFSAERPEDFALVDLNDYRDRLEASDLKALAETQAAIGRDGRKARDQGAELKDAFDMAKARLEDAGAILPGEEDSGDQRQLLAKVQNAVYTGLADFRAQNPGVKPAPADIRKMIDPFLLPYYLPQPDPKPKPKVKLSDISPDLRTSITRQLAMELGRKPTDGEVAREYAAFRQSQVG